MVNTYGQYVLEKMAILLLLMVLSTNSPTEEAAEAESK